MKDFLMSWRKLISPVSFCDFRGFVILFLEMFVTYGYFLDVYVS